MNSEVIVVWLDPVDSPPSQFSIVLPSWVLHQPIIPTLTRRTYKHTETPVQGKISKPVMAQLEDL